MAQLHYMGLPHAGPQEELRHALERYGTGKICREDLDNTAAILRNAQWQRQIESGASLLTVGDFCFTAPLLEQSLMFGLQPEAAFDLSGLDVIDRAIALTRTVRRSPPQPAPDQPMPNWFDGGDERLRPYCDADKPLQLDARLVLEQLDEAIQFATPAKLALIGPATLAWYSRLDGLAIDDVIDRLLPLYQQLFDLAKAHGAAWIQLDEPILCLDLPTAWRARFERIYNILRTAPAPLMLATYGGGLKANLSLTLQLPVQAVHVDLIAAPDQLVRVRDQLGPYKVLSVGVIDGRHPTGLAQESPDLTLRALARQMGDRLWISSNCAIAADESSTPNRPISTGYARMETILTELPALLETLNSPRTPTPKPHSLCL